MSSCAYFQGKVIPQAKQKAADSLTKAIVKTGECVAMDQVRLDVEKLFKIESNDSMVVKAMGSESSPEGAQEEGVVSEICKAAAKLAIPTLLSKGVPEKWDCRLTDMSSKVTELASKACGEIPI
jgi:hypothetical protein